MGRKNIEKFSVWYYLLKVYARAMHYMYYGRLRVRGKEHIPYGEPMIFAPNHQNALMDALAVLFTIPRQMVFLARADIFKRGFFSAILTFMKILPIYRIRDGYSSLQSNSEIFDKTVEVIRAGRPLVILPEGNHEGIRRLRPLKKGIARIAFQTEEACNFSLGINIIPVGLDYSRYEKSGSELLIQYGLPIKVNDYAAIYQENPAKGVNELIAELKSRISELMIDIHNEENYEMIDIIRRSYAHTILKHKHLKLTPWNRHAAEIETIRILEAYLADAPDTALVDSLDASAKDYRLALGYNKLQFRNPEEGRWPWWKIVGQSILFLLALPLFVIGFINNIFPVLIPKSIVKRIKDVQFRSSFKFGVSILTFPVFYGIQVLLFCVFVPLPPIYTLWYFISLPITGVIAVRYRLFFRRFLSRLRYRFLFYTAPSQWHRIQALRDQILGGMALVVSKVQ
ncbi:MAG: 1-acyl-sn-glycerol-3-phosphate acyltransferase [Bacteroidales bacterium]